MVAEALGRLAPFLPGAELAAVLREGISVLAVDSHVQVSRFLPGAELAAVLREGISVLA